MPALIAGVDEVGRGPLAGPVVAAAVVLDAGRPITGLRDSKCLSAAGRRRLEALIRDRALDFAIGRAEVEEIDRLNVLQAALLAMRRAVLALRVAPVRVIVDGLQRPDVPGEVIALVRADARVAEVSAASIIAKEARDREMCLLDRTYPEYGFSRHKGYPTREHLASLARFGPCAVHRRTFAPVRRAGGVR